MPFSSHLMSHGVGINCKKTKKVTNVHFAVAVLTVCLRRFKLLIVLISYAFLNTQNWCLVLPVAGIVKHDGPL